MAKQLSLFDDNPIPRDHVGGFCDFLPPELHDFGRPGRLTLIIASDQVCHNDFIKCLSEGVKADSSLTGLWLSLCLKLDGTTVIGAFNPLHLLKERKRLKILVEGCHNSCYARIRAAKKSFLTRDYLRLTGADIFSVEYSGSAVYIRKHNKKRPLSDFIIKKLN